MDHKSVKCLDLGTKPGSDSFSSKPGPETYLFLAALCVNFGQLILTSSVSLLVFNGQYLRKQNETDTGKLSQQE